MRKIRYGLTLVALLASLIGSAFLGLGSSPLASIASSQHATTHTVALIRRPPCPGIGSDDC